MASITAFGRDHALLREATTRAIEEFQRLENALSIFLPSSRVSLINAAAGRHPVQAGADLAHIVAWSKAVWSQTRGTFDITIGPLMELWGFRGNPLQSVPDEQELRRRLSAIGHDKIEVDEGAGTVGLTHPSARIDLGGIGVGYALDRCADILKGLGVESAFVNHSGDAIAFGIPDESDGWEIGIPDPSFPGRLVERRMIADGAVATSGGYRQFVTMESRRWAHIIDPRSGIPGETLLSTTVFAPNAVTADTLSTSMFCLSGDVSGVLDSFPGTSLLEVSCVAGGETTRVTTHQKRKS